MLSPLRKPHRFALTLFASLFAFWLIIMFALMRASSLPADATGTMLVVFDLGTTEDQAFATIVNAGARPIRGSAFSFIWVVTGEEPGLAGRLEASGALGAYRELPLSPTIAGCVAVADAKVADVFGFR